MIEYEIAKEKIVEFIRKDVLSARDEKCFASLVLDNEDVAKEVYHATYDKAGYPIRYKIVTTLTGDSRGEDIAKEEIKVLVQRLTFRDCSPELECAFRNWLLCESDVMPLELPTEKKVMGFFTRQQYQTICCMTKVSQFSARICVYGMVKGYMELFKDTLQNIIIEFGIDYAREFINQLVKCYNVADAYLMAMVAAIYAGPAKSKLEITLYREYIEKWRDSNRDYFIAEISSVLGNDWRKKVLKKFEKEGI
ncbi:MAG: hypothetical protein E7290_00600 [Lachnospiraceae bacterium]|nr:hypothetical protein [Lachnospiraceae bacterium]